MLASDSKKVTSIVVLAGRKDVNNSLMVVVHCRRRRRARRVVCACWRRKCLATVANTGLMPSTKPPNPWLFAAVSVSSLFTFYIILKQREKSHPLSQQPRQADHPLVPPFNRKDSDN